jgi:hypothetical protein
VEEVVMRRWVLPTLTVLVIAVVGPTLAGAVKTSSVHKCSFRVTGLFAGVKVHSGTPPVSGSQTLAATLDGKLCRKSFHGAARQLNKYPTPGTFTSKGRAFGLRGSLKTTTRGGVTSTNPDGSISLKGSGKITGGTGIYKGATGSFSFTGRVPPTRTPVTQHIKGKFKY